MLFCGVKKEKSEIDKNISYGIRIMNGFEYQYMLENFDNENDFAFKNVQSAVRWGLKKIWEKDKEIKIELEEIEKDGVKYKVLKESFIKILNGSICNEIGSFIISNNILTSDKKKA